MTTTEVKIRTYRVSRWGERGFIVSIPAVWAKDVHLQPGDRVAMYRDIGDRLIIAPPAKGSRR